MLDFFRNHQETHTIQLSTHPRCSFLVRGLCHGVAQREMRCVVVVGRMCFHVLTFFGRHISKKNMSKMASPPQKKKIVGGFNPVKKFVKLEIFPKVRGENKKYLSCHHLKHPETIPPELPRIALRLPLRGSLPPVAGPAIARQPWQWLQG